VRKRVPAAPALKLLRAGRGRHPGVKLRSTSSTGGESLGGELLDGLRKNFGHPTPRSLRPRTECNLVVGNNAKKPVSDPDKASMGQGEAGVSYRPLAFDEHGAAAGAVSRGVVWRTPFILHMIEYWRIRWPPAKKYGPVAFLLPATSAARMRTGYFCVTFRGRRTDVITQRRLISAFGQSGD